MVALPAKWLPLAGLQGRRGWQSMGERIPIDHSLTLLGLCHDFCLSDTEVSWAQLEQ